MAIYNLDKYKLDDGFGLPLNIRRGNPNPLDNSEVWSSLESAESYASSSPIAYVGQAISVVSRDDEGALNAKRYIIINEEGTLQEVGSGGSSVQVDNKTISNDSGIIAIKGFKDALPGYQLRKTEQNTLEWFLPNTEKIDELIDIVDELSDAVNEHTNIIAILTADEDTTGSVLNSIHLAIFDDEGNARYASKPIVDQLVDDVISINDRVLVLENIGVATPVVLGLVKSSNEENKVSVNEDGIMEVNAVNVNKLVQTEDEELILFGGTAN